MSQCFPSVFLAVLLLLVICSLQVILSGATVTVGTSSQWANEGSDNSVTCIPSDSIFFLRWYVSSITEEFIDAQQILQLYVVTSAVTLNPSVNQSHYSFNKSASNFPLTVNGVGFGDEVSYWCEVEPENGDPNEKDRTTFQVRRIPASIVLKHGNTSYNDGSEVPVIKGENQFECSVPNIKPAATFAWRLGSTDLDSFTEWNETNGDPRLVNSYSALTVSVDADSRLTCSAQNKQDGTSTPDQTISIMLKPSAAPEPSLSIVAIIGIAGGSLCGVAVAAVGGIAGVKYYKKTKVTPDSNQSKKGEEKKADGGKADV